MPDGTIIQNVPDGITQSELMRRYQKLNAPAKPSILGGAVNAFNQGISLGGADELMAGAESALGGRPYEQSMREQAAQRQAFSAEHPWLAAGATGLGAIAPVVMATIGGSLTPAGPVGGAAAGGAAGARGLSLFRQALYGGGQPLGPVNTVAQAAKEGARIGFTPGAVTGALSADPYGTGPVADMIGPRSVGAAQGAGIGMAVGAVAGGGSQAIINASQRAAPYLQRVSDIFNAEAGGVSRAAPAGPRGPTMRPITRPEAKILRAMEQGGITPEVAAARLAEARRLGVPLGLVDVAGQPMQRLGRAVRTLPGEGSATMDTALTARANEAPARITRTLERGIGRVSDGNAAARSDALLQQARADSAPFYARLDRLPPVQSPEVRTLFQTPNVRRLVQDAERAAQGWGETVAPLYDDAGNLTRDITFRDIDLVKQELDDVLRPVFQQGARPAESVAVSTRLERGLAGNIRRRLLDIADSAPGGNVYATARRSYAGPRRARDMFEMGREFSKRPTELEDIRAVLRTANPAELKWFERGAAEALRGKIESVPDLSSTPNVLRQVFGSPADRAKLAAVTNPRRAPQMTRRLELENQAAQTRNYVQTGSQTADKAAEAADFVTEFASDAATGQGTASGMLSTAVRNGIRWFQSRVNSEVNQEIARQLVNFSDEAAQRQFLSRLTQLHSYGMLRAQDVQEVARAMAVQVNAR